MRSPCCCAPAGECLNPGGANASPHSRQVGRVKLAIYRRRWCSPASTHGLFRLALLGSTRSRLTKDASLTAGRCFPVRTASTLAYGPRTLPPWPSVCWHLQPAEGVSRKRSGIIRSARTVPGTCPGRSTRRPDGPYPALRWRDTPVGHDAIREARHGLELCCEENRVVG